MLFATIAPAKYHRVCSGYPLICRMVPNLAGFGDSIDQADTCTQNPNDPICVAYYGSAGASQAAAAQSTASAASMPSSDLCSTDADCPSGFTCNFISGGCEPMTKFTAGKPTTMPAASAAAAAGVGFKPISYWLAAGVLVLGGGAYFLIRRHEKKHGR